MRELKVMGSLLTSEADPMSAMKFKMNSVNEALRSELHFYKNTGVREQKEHNRYRQVVQSCL